MKIVDCDIHQNWSDPALLNKRLPAYFRESHFHLAGMDTPSPVGVIRQDVTKNGISAECDPDAMREQHMDAFGISVGILTGSGTLTAGVHPHLEFGNAVMRAYNDLLIETWLTWDRRFLGAIMINPQDPQEAAREIRRVGEHPRIVEVLMSSGARTPFGQKFYWPIYEAAVEMGLPVSTHPGTEARGTANCYVAGPVSTYLEWHTNIPQNYMGHIVSLACEGVFEKFPTLKFIAIEGGLAWIPGVLWRLDKNWKALRSSVPWLKRLPSEYIIDHVRFTTQPIEEPPDSRHLPALLEMISAEKTVMFSSDFPHWDNDSPMHALPRLPEALAERIYHKNAEETYGPKLTAVLDQAMPAAATPA